MTYVGTGANLTPTANDLVYSTSSSLALLPTANNGVLVTSNLGVPSIGSTLPTAVQLNITTVGTIGTGIWNGSVIQPAYGGTGINNGLHTITIGGDVNIAGSLVTTGLYPVTFNFTGPTNVTFPTSGTLATVGGTISNVVGTANQIDVSVSSGIATVSIDPNYVGQTSITTVGTITTGTWNGNIIDSFHGGTGLGAPSPGEMLIGSGATNFYSFIPAPSGFQILGTDVLGGVFWLSTLPTVVQTNITEVGTIASGTWNGNVISPQYGGTGVNNGSSKITIGGNTTFTGSFTFNGNITGNTNVTFPTSGTLSTTSSVGGANFVSYTYFGGV